MSKRLIVLVPTHDRQANCRRLAESFLATQPKNSRIVFAIDEAEMGLYESNGVSSPLVDYWYCPGSNTSAQRLNKIVPALAEQSDIILLVCDEAVFRTQDWETQIIDAFNDGAVIVAPDDGLRGIVFSTYYALDTRLVRRLGYYAPPALKHMYTDNFLLDTGRALGKFRFLPLCFIEHMHPMVGKSDADQSHAESNALLKQDGEAYAEYVRTQRDHDIIKLRLEFGWETIPVVKFPGIEGRNLRVLITTPFGHAELTHNYYLSTISETQVLALAGVDVQLQPVNNAIFGAPVNIQRNQLTHLFRKGDFKADAQVCLDSDNGFRGSDILRMLASGCPLIGLNCPKKKYVVSGLSGEYQTLKEAENAMLEVTIRTVRNGKTKNGMREVYFVGTGVLVIWRSVYEDIIKAGVVSNIRFIDEWKETTDCWRFWHFDICDANHPLGEGYEIMEDWNFCDLARRAGHSIWCDPRAEASHMGMKNFAGIPRWPSKESEIIAGNKENGHGLEIG